MSAFTATQLRALIHEVITGANRAIILAEPGLAWLLPELEARRDSLDALLGGKASDDTLTIARKRVGDADVGHDESHRLLRGLLEACLHEGPPERRALLANAHDVLYPDGLRGVGASYRQEVANTHTFALRLERPDVQAGLDALGERVKQARQVAKACVRAGEALGDALRALELAEADDAAKPRERELFYARLAAHKSWSAFVTNVEHVLSGDAPEVVRKRETLLGRWRGYLDGQRRGASAQPAEPAEPAPGEPEPA